jgi:hypothetical protein
MTNFIVQIIIGAIITFILIKLVNAGYLSWNKIIVIDIFVFIILFVSAFILMKK